MKGVQQKSAASTEHALDLVRVLVGPEEREFTVSRTALCSSSPFFRSHLAASPHSPSSPQSALHLPSTRPSTFELFTLHLHHPRTFTTFISTSIAALDDLPETGSPTSSSSSTLLDLEPSRVALHWTLVHLHLFGASISLPSLQDATMDGIQDLYLHYDWDVSPSFVRHLYCACDPVQARRLRKWAVAMVAWTVALCGESAAWHDLLEELDAFRREYASHMDKMALNRSRGVDVRVKNPQLRLPRNRLKSEERYFGFRLCSFHSHRGVVGEGPCLHTTYKRERAEADVQGWYDVVDLERRGGGKAEVAAAVDEMLGDSPRCEVREETTSKVKCESKRQAEVKHEVEKAALMEGKQPEAEAEKAQGGQKVGKDQDRSKSPQKKEKKPSPVSMLIRDGFYLDVS